MILFYWRALGSIGSRYRWPTSARLRATDIVIADTLGVETKWRNIASYAASSISYSSPPKSRLSSAIRRDVAAGIHYAANSSTTARDGDEMIRSNFRLSTRLWDWCARNRVSLVYASSGANTYGGGEQGFGDDDSDAELDRLRPLNLYGWSKHAFDRWALEQARKGSAPPQWVGLKFFNVSWPGN